jgi:hypothetical protein
VPRVFSLTFYGVDGHLWVEHLLLGLPGGQIGFLIVVNLLVFLLAFFLDFFELAFIVVPLLAPVADKLGIDLVWFGVLLAVNMQTSFMHPPFGFALFYLRSVAPQTPPSNCVCCHQKRALRRPFFFHSRNNGFPWTTRQSIHPESRQLRTDQPERSFCVTENRQAPVRACQAPVGLRSCAWFTNRKPMSGS